jgi:hypothetical protein
VEAKNGGLAYDDVNVASTLFDASLEEFVDEHSCHERSIPSGDSYRKSD